MAGDCCAPVAAMLLACAGGSNAGQLTTQAVVELSPEGVGKPFCPAGIAAQASGFVQSARDSPGRWCWTAVRFAQARQVSEAAEVPLRGSLLFSSLGREKNKNLRLRGRG